MLRRIYTLMIKEFLAVWQDKKSRTVLILPPFVQLFIFAFAATLDVENVTIAILNKDMGKPAYELVQRFKGSPTFTHIRYLKTVSEIKETMDNQRALMIIHIDEDFSRNLLANKQAYVQLILDGRKSNSAQVVQGYASKIIQQFNVDFLRELGKQPETTILIPRNWFNPNLIYTWFTVPGLVALITMFTCLIVTSLSIARERELGTFEQLLVSPLRPIEILIGKTIPGIVIGMIEGTIILLASILAFGIPFTGSLTLLYFSMLVFVSSIVGIGLFLSSLSKTQQQALLAVFIFASPAVTLSGFATPIENMPDWMQTVTLINPLRYFLVIVRGLFLKEMPFSIVCSYLYPLAIIGIFNLGVSVWFFRRRVE